MDLSLPAAVEVVKALAVEQNRYVLDRWSSIGAIVHKDRRDIQTSIDVDVEEAIIHQLQARFPSHGFHGEETGRHNPDAQYQWLIDPIDGTKNYVAQSSLFAISISLLLRDEPILGVVYNSTAGQCFSAYRGGGAFLDGKRLMGSTAAELSGVLANIDMPGMDILAAEERFWFETKLVELTRKLYRVRSLGTGSLAACWLATGALDAYVDLTGYIKPQDLAAGRVIMREAGATVEYVDVGVGPPRLVAAHPEIYPLLQSLLLAKVAAEETAMAQS
jgi:fructose-1,6-bisphosphatase/inositol monophosphatase family enzyme